jgi:DNA-binding NtrC family response regulator
LLRGALFESQLFGHLPGAFASLSTSALGCFGSAEGGVVYLADVDQLDRASQEQLREVVERRTLVPRGGREAIAFDVRLIAGTTVDLQALVERHEFDARLYRHFAAQTVHAADLRDRRDDLDELAARFLDDAAHQHGAAQPRLSSSARAWMRTYSWPGNVAQLRKVMLGAAATRRPLIDCELLRRIVASSASGRASVN